MCVWGHPGVRVGAGVGGVSRWYVVHDRLRPGPCSGLLLLLLPLLLLCCRL